MYTGKSRIASWMTGFIMVSLVFFVCVAVSSCEQDEESLQKDEVSKAVTIKKESSVDVSITTEHGTAMDIIKTVKTFYGNFGEVLASKVDYDTVPQLGMKTDTLDTGRTRVNSEGDDEEVDTVVTHPKNYQFYITVK